MSASGATTTNNCIHVVARPIVSLFPCRSPSLSTAGCLCLSPGGIGGRPYLVRAACTSPTPISPTTRALMERDMLVRKFQKENLDDLFAVIRKNLSGMRCLARFAEEQRMGGEVGFFMEVEGIRIISRG